MRETAIGGLNEALLATAAGAKVLKTSRVHADTIVIEANVAYASDSSLLVREWRKMATTTKKLRAMGLATRTRLADKTRTVRSRARSIHDNKLIGVIDQADKQRRQKPGSKIV